MFFQDIYVDYLNPKFHDDGIVIVAFRACQRGPILPRERVLGLKFMFLDPKEVSKPKMSLIEVVGHILIDFGTTLQVICSMYVVRNPKKRLKIYSHEEEIWLKMIAMTEQYAWLSTLLSFADHIHWPNDFKLTTFLVWRPPCCPKTWFLVKFPPRD